MNYLYRLFDANDQLLYVGISKSAIHRLHQHLEQQPWSEQIAKQTVERFKNRDDLLRAERAAIKAEQPKHNLIHNTRADLETPKVKRRPRKESKYGRGTVRQLPSGKWQAAKRNADGKYEPAPETFTTQQEAADWLKAQRPLLLIGDCVALGLSDGRCPVGEIEALNSEWLRLRLKNFWTGYYDGEIHVYQFADIEEMRIAPPLDDPHDPRTVDDDLLGDFQSEWKAKHGVPKYSPEWEETLRAWGELA